MDFLFRAFRTKYSNFLFSVDASEISVTDREIGESMVAEVADIKDKKEKKMFKKAISGTIFMFHCKKDEKQ